MIRRRVDDTSATLQRLVDQGHELQERLARAEAWVTTESETMGAKYTRLVGEVKSAVLPLLKEAWETEPVTTAAKDESEWVGRRPMLVLKPGILLEMGVRGKDEPEHIVREVGPLFADVRREGFEPSDYSDLDPFSVDVLHPARTLWEKVVLLHKDVTTDEWRNHDPSRFARHYGDVGALLALTEVRNLLGDPVVRSHVDHDVRDVSAQWFGGEPPPAPDGGYGFSDALVLAGEFGEYLEEHFADAVNALWAPSHRPSLDQVLRTVEENAEILDPGSG